MSTGAALVEVQQWRSAQHSWKAQHLRLVNVTFDKAPHWRLVNGALVDTHTGEVPHWRLVNSALVNVNTGD